MGKRAPITVAAEVDHSSVRVRSLTGFASHLVLETGMSQALQLVCDELNLLATVLILVRVRSKRPPPSMHMIHPHTSMCHLNGVGLL